MKNKTPVPEQPSPKTQATRKERRKINRKKKETNKTHQQQRIYHAQPKQFSPTGFQLSHQLKILKIYERLFSPELYWPPVKESRDTVRR